MSDIIDQLKAALGMTTEPETASVAVPPAPAEVAPPKPDPEPAPVPAVLVVPPADLVATPEQYAALQAQIAKQNEALVLLAARPTGETATPVAPKMPGLLDQKGMEAALRTQFGDSASTGDLSFSWVNSSPLAIPKTIPRMP